MRGSRTGGWFLATLAGWLLVTASPVLAENIVVKNSTALPVVVQATAVVRGQLIRDKPQIIASMGTSANIVLPGNKVLTIYDARNANRILAQVPIPGGNDDVAMEVTPDSTSPTGIRLSRVNPR
jgi:hypothetical protein